jgi:hypothetical protein
MLNVTVLAITLENIISLTTGANSYADGFRPSA